MSRPQTNRINLIAVLILCLALWLRLTDLYSLPVFGDETDHLFWAQEFSQGRTNYPLLMDGKFLMGVLVAQFQPLGPDPLWLARSVIALFSLLSVAACLLLGRRLGSPAAGLLAGFFYAVLPQAVFHERQMLADPLMAAFGSVTIALTLRLAQRGSWRIGLMLALGLAATILAKLFGGLYLAYPGWACLLLVSRIHWKKSWIKIIGATVLGLGLMGGYLLALGPRIGNNDEKLVNNQVGFVHCPPLLCQADLSQQLDDLQNTLPFLDDTFRWYLGWPVALLALLAWPLAAPQKRRPAAWLFLSALMTLIAFLLASREFPPRYIYFINTPLVCLAALAIVSLAQSASARLNQPYAGAAVGLTLIVVSLVPMTNTIPMIWAPRQASLARLDSDHFYTGYFRAGFQAAANFITAQDTGDFPPYVLADGKSNRSLMAYLDRRRITVVRAPETDFNQLGQLLLQGQPVYYFDLVATGGQGGVWIPYNTIELARYFHTDRLEVRVYRVLSANAEQRESLFQRFFILPDELTSNYADLLGALPADRPITLLVYPPNHAQTLAQQLDAGQSQVSVYPVGDSWPLDPAELATQLQSIANAADIRVVFLEEINGDPQRLIETWVNTHLFRLDEQWFGPVHLINFAGPGGAAQTIPVAGRFGDGIQLDTVETLDLAASPGGLIRLRLTWQALQPVPRQFKVFTHIFANERIAAQHDGQAVGELRPTTTWQTGETILDQFAIRIPADAQAGGYQIRIGLYDIETGERLPLTLPDGSVSEFFEGGQITIK